LIFRCSPRLARGLFFSLPNPPPGHGVEAHDDRVMSL